jgi:hypothetical protein
MIVDGELGYCVIRLAYGELDLTWDLMALCLCMSSLQAK